MTQVPRRNLAVPLGILLVMIGLLLVVVVLGTTILPEAIVESRNRQVALCSIGFLFIGLGLYLLVKRPSITVIHVSAFALVGALSAFLGALTLQVAYVPPRLVAGWKSSLQTSELNELGFRGIRIDYADADCVIVLLGDSHVEAKALHLEAIPARRLESHLSSQGRRVRVHTVGTWGYGQDQQLLALQEYFQKYRADLVVLWQEPRNDLWNNVFRTHMYNRNPKPTFWLDGTGLRGPTESLGEPLANSSIVVVALWQRVFGLPYRDQKWEDKLPEAYSPLTRFDGVVNTEWQARWDTNRGLMRSENLLTEKSHMAVMLTPRSPRTQYGLDLTRALLNRIRDLAASNHSKLVIFQVDDHYFKSNDEQMYVLNGKYFRVAKQQFDENWHYVHQGFDATIIPVTVDDWRVRPDDAHYNERATDQIMGDLARFLKDRIPSSCGR
jgi:hypothetical protein